MAGVKRKMVWVVAGIALTFCCTLGLAQETVVVPSVNAELGPCSADFTVTDETGKPVAGAAIHVSVPFTTWHDGRQQKRTDAEQVETNSEGRARVLGLPTQPLKQVGNMTPAAIVFGPLIDRTCTFRITHGHIDRSLAIQFADSCHRDLNIVLGKAEAPDSGSEPKH